MAKGTVLFFSDERGWGFIESDDGKSYFVHFKEINKAGFKTIEKGERVTFTPGVSSRGQVAQSVVPLRSIIS